MSLNIKAIKRNIKKEIQAKTRLLGRIEALENLVGSYSKGTVTTTPTRATRAYPPVTHRANWATHEQTSAIRNTLARMNTTRSIRAISSETGIGYNNIWRVLHKPTSRVSNKMRDRFVTAISRYGIENTHGIASTHGQTSLS